MAAGEGCQGHALRACRVQCLKVRSRALLAAPTEPQVERSEDQELSGCDFDYSGRSCQSPGAYGVGDIVETCWSWRDRMSRRHNLSAHLWLGDP